MFDEASNGPLMPTPHLRALAKGLLQLRGFSTGSGRCAQGFNRGYGRALASRCLSLLVRPHVCRRLDGGRLHHGLHVHLGLDCR